MAEDGEFLGIVAYEGRLLDFLCRFADCNLYLHWFVEDIACQGLNLVWHGGREHDGLSVLGKSFYYGHDVVIESHVEHTVGLVEHEEADTTQIDVAHAYMTEKSARGGYDYVGTHAQATHLLVVACSVVAAIHSHTADAIEIVSEALHSLVYLLS